MEPDHERISSLRRRCPAGRAHTRFEKGQSADSGWQDLSMTCWRSQTNTKVTSNSLSQGISEGIFKKVGSRVLPDVRAAGVAPNSLVQGISQGTLEKVWSRLLPGVCAAGVTPNSLVQGI